MAYLIGTDEAGYGPNLGPLVIAATLWRLPNGMLDEDLYALLPTVSAQRRQAAGGDNLVVIADSKTLYTPQTGLAAIERNTLAAWGLADSGKQANRLGTWESILTACDASVGEVLARIPWYDRVECAVPVEASSDQIQQTRENLRSALENAEIELQSIRAQVVFPERFNRRIDECGSKGEALSLWTMELIEQLIAPLGDEPISVQCDKHGGRNRYGSLLQHIFWDQVIVVREEAKAQSVYRWGSPSRPVEARFTAKGDRLLPSALASMAAKYVRELTMIAFNAFWQRHLPGIKKTAGYPTDARRFRREIAELQRRLQIPDAILWRQR